MELLRVLYEGKSPKLCDEEEFLGTLVAYDRGRGGMLEQPLHEMLVAMRFDIERERALADHAELHRNYEREVSSYLFTIAYFCAVPVTPAKIPGSEAAKGAKIAHILRDFIVDCADGQFNISRQEIAAYRLDLKSINTQITGLAGRRWVAVKVRIAERQLSSGLQDVSSGSEELDIASLLPSWSPSTRPTSVNVELTNLPCSPSSRFAGAALHENC